MNATCLYCGETITMLAGKGWVHSDGHTYKGECRCEVTAVHPYSHDDAGNLICRTWRDHHCAVPDRSGVTA